MKEEWLFPGAVVPVDVETTAVLVAEIKRLIDVVGGLILKQGPDYERGFIDGMQKQMQSSVDKAVNTMAQPVQKRPQNCGTGYCSCIECVMEPKQPKVRTGNCLRVGVCASEGHKIAPQRKPLTDDEIETLFNATPAKRDGWKAFARAIEAAHFIKENT